ncbi:MAG: response regulator transcription factor [Candidatus Promineifilaceae bacterium]|nr:response regulator transcription factor [Candidatus Promineifilaceae bacterium]
MDGRAQELRQVFSSGWTEKGSLSASAQLEAIVLSSCRLYRRAWESVLIGLEGVSVVQTVAAVEDIMVSDHDGPNPVIVVDMPGQESQMARRLSPHYERSYALFVVNDYDLTTILPLLRLGVTGFAARPDPLSCFDQAFRAAAQGKSTLPPEVACRALSALSGNGRPRPSSSPDLTNREKEVLQLLAGGLSNQAIARSLYVSTRTVEAHLRNVYGKLAVSSRTEAVLWAVRHGFAPPITYQ